MCRFVQELLSPRIAYCWQGQSRKKHTRVSVFSGEVQVQTVIYVFDNPPYQAEEELLTELLARKGVRIERIVAELESQRWKTAAP